MNDMKKVAVNVTLQGYTLAKIDGLIAMSPYQNKPSRSAMIDELIAYAIEHLQKDNSPMALSIRGGRMVPEEHEG